MLCQLRMQPKLQKAELKAVKPSRKKAQFEVSDWNAKTRLLRVNGEDVTLAEAEDLSRISADTVFVGGEIAMTIQFLKVFDT